MDDFKPYLKNWKTLLENEFIDLNFNNFVIKFRDALGKKILFNQVEPVKGINLIDVMGVDDYFLGEFISIDNKIFKPIMSKNALILKSKHNRKYKLKVLRDDGFIKLYRVINGSYILTII